MIHNMRRAFIACIFLASSIAACGTVKVTIDHNTGDAATAEFKFKRVPSPARNNAATNAKFKPEPDANTDPVTCGWKLIATVDTRPKQGDSGGQYGVSVSDSGVSLGKFRYLLFDSIPSEDDDPWGNTFFSEIDVIAKEVISR